VDLQEKARENRKVRAQLDEDGRKTRVEVEELRRRRGGGEEKRKKERKERRRKG